MNFLKKRKLSVDIFIAFFFLLIIAFFSLVTVNYQKTSKGILEFSKGTIHRVNALIIEKIDCLLNQLESLPEITAPLFLRHPTISLENEILLNHLLDEIRIHKELYNFYVANNDGKFLGVGNLTQFDRGDIFFKAPPNSQYVVILSDPQKQSWSYYSKDLKLLEVVNVANINYDPTSRNWFIDAVESKKTQWTGLYQFAFTQNVGITVSKPILDNNGNLVGVLGGDLTLNNFSKFIENQKIGQNGRTYVVDQNRKIILPINLEKANMQQIIDLSSQQEGMNQVVEFANEKYLVSIEDIPISSKVLWKIATIIPFLDLFQRLVNLLREEIYIAIGILIFSGFFAGYFSRKVAKPIMVLASELYKIKNFELLSQTHVQSSIYEIELLDHSVCAMRQALRSFSKFVPKDVVKSLLHHGKEIDLGGEKRDITLFFSDIKDLTKISEELELEVLNALLAEYFDGMSKILLKESATIDKYIGDCIMAFWNAPEDLENHEKIACFTALRCRAFIKSFNHKQQLKNMPKLETRIGINTGSVIVGNIGTHERMNYTVIGDAVNTTQRIEQMNKVYQTQILIGEKTAQKIQDEFLIRLVDCTEVKGKKAKIKIFELIDLKNHATKEEIEKVDKFNQAYQFFVEQDFKRSYEIFSQLAKTFPEDGPTSVYLEKLNSILRM